MREVREAVETLFPEIRKLVNGCLTFATTRHALVEHENQPCWLAQTQLYHFWSKHVLNGVSAFAGFQPDADIRVKKDVTLVELGGEVRRFGPRL